jgi:hypothetical protein
LDLKGKKCQEAGENLHNEQLLTKYSYDDQEKDDEVGVACRPNDEMGNAYFLLSCR